MVFIRLIVLVAVAVTGAGLGRAQTREDLERCRRIEDEARRLGCYDAIRLAPTSARRKYEAVPLDELKEYALTFRGQLVEVTGWVVPDERFFFLGLDETDERPLPIDPGPLSRRDRQAFLDDCGAGCTATIQGRVRPVNFTTGLVADELIVH